MSACHLPPPDAPLPAFFALSMFSSAVPFVPLYNEVHVWSCIFGAIVHADKPINRDTFLGLQTQQQLHRNDIRDTIWQHRPLGTVVGCWMQEKAS